MITTQIRNFAIIAHIDHGKSTLADRLLELTGILTPGKHDEQYLDRNPISRERGITIKLAPVRMEYELKKNNNQTSTVNEQEVLVNYHRFPYNNSKNKYILNLIDTPGHIDFAYEVERTLACVEGVVLLVDATQGIQAQTVSNTYRALEKNLSIIPVINKIDLPSAQIEMTKRQLVNFLGVKEENIVLISAKTSQGVDELLKVIIEKIPPPKINQTHFTTEDFKSLIFDSYYHTHRGVVAFIRVFEGLVQPGQKVKLMATNQIFEVEEVGYFAPDLTKTKILYPGEIGYIVTNLKDIHKVRVGDTIASVKVTTPLPGYQKIKPMVFASIFPTDTNDFLLLKNALEKISLTDSSLVYRSIYSQALGSGFRVGFLGLLHAEVVKERLEREFNLSLVLTPAQVEFKFDGKNYYEPYAKVLIITPNKYLGSIIQLVQNYRAIFKSMNNIGSTVDNTLELIYEMPLVELMSDFFDQIKSLSSGFASLDWEFLDYRLVKAGKLKLMINNNPIEEFSEIVVENKAYQKANYLVHRLKVLIPRQQYEVKIQASYNGKIIASLKISPFKKNVLMKAGKVLGTGDVGRKKKLLERQKEGKKKMKMVGNIEIPKDAFLKIYKKND